MKKFIVLLVILFIGTGCSGSSQSDITLDDLSTQIFDVLMEKREFLLKDEITVLGPIFNDNENIVDGTFIGGTVVDATKAIIVEVKPGSDTTEIVKALEDVLANDKATFKNYVPEQNKFVTDGQVVVKAQYVILYIAENSSDITKLLDSIF